MKDIIKLNTFQNKQRNINTDLNGENQDCPKGDKQKHEIDSPKNKNDDSNENDKDKDKDNDENEDKNEEELVNKTFELCRTLIFPLLSLISRSFNIFDYKDIFINNNTKKLILSALHNKIKLENYNYIINIMNIIIDNNIDIVNNIREIYRTASPDKLRCLISKHFIPTKEEKKNNAEIPTPVELVDEMLDKIPIEFWTTPKKVFEPCCGKGNFVLGIFDRFFKGLEKMYPDTTERCNVIITECIYYGDLTPLNVFITTELLKCHIEKYCSSNKFDFEFSQKLQFNNYIGDTLKINMDIFSVNGFDAVIGNPPYNDNSGNKGKGHILWNLFIEMSLNKWLLKKGYLLFVTPSLWRQPDHQLQNIMKTKQIIYLEIHDEKDGLKTFKCNTRYDIYLIQNKPYKTNTIIKTQKGEIININLIEWNFIPNYNFEFIEKIIKGKEKVNILHSESKYEVRRPHMSHNKTETYKHPCIYSISRSNELSFKWSNTKEKGMFNVPKVVFGSGATGFIVDKNGDYGMTQWATGIVDDIENLETIVKVLNSDKFKDIILATSVSKCEINRKILKYFKKDFWKEFI